jgi:hypothetical protein
LRNGKRDASWCAQRYSKNLHKVVCNGNYKDEESAAHASDTLARQLIKNGEKGHKLNFPDEQIEVYAEMKTSKYIGVSCNKRRYSQRRSRNKNKKVYVGTYKDEGNVAHASDDLARKSMANSNNNLELNFQNDSTEVHPEETKTSKYFGVSKNKKDERWHAQRRSKKEKKVISNGTYDNEKTAAHASDTLARELIENGEHGHKLNFPDDHTAVISRNMMTSKYIGVSYNRKVEKWQKRCELVRTKIQ